MRKRRKDLSPDELARKELIREYLSKTPNNSLDFSALIKEMMGQMLEGALDGELEEQLGYSKYDYRNKPTDNSRNGYSKKTLKSSSGEIDINVPRDRNSNFEPQIIKKHQSSISQDFEEKVTSLFAKGMTLSDIKTHVADMYDFDISESSISRITDKILPIAKEWQDRPLEDTYAVVFMDAIHYNVRSEGRIVKKAVYIALGINMDGMKEVLGMWVGENESAKFWLLKMNELKNRGVNDILIICVDSLTGFSNAIAAVFPDTEIQKCIIHQIRNTTRYVSYKDVKELMIDLKKIYKANTEDIALFELDNFE